ncbi:conserved Plasmodium protein, unknown function [Plasmodium knowlesi strain H]|uniref:Uncharacterized protein n=3 Tax=Plasmodium knowlesi TaxID=5850 RepID=A0A5K1VGF5_PLAKH|nr:conserved Plasmodium protein, unknown function [Plasmodium knowlesi strain H]OTN64775.1 Uncharacterized protein PKNOH_S130201500 [Plasmodium knowlesi]CAA9989175.1 conserved Plasmodium protein, unknown function [Plasmodium knowlesi strain H]SBO27395.1 conserved Plasmodium protein, unknown function [Plasmodium knowlesi strain H]SBO27495.1 conserved Plasmodium protein, unknown function [Plasmodium knowlesi strain H]VVS78649.1 conserved Plasmodium protein, unknown function [Plasmodium knowlesi |eukprot:XP_002261522.1 hypothetical protein, conserved in Plasmodium species [Plasmodium knowlesi strain H]
MNGMEKKKKNDKNKREENTPTIFKVPRYIPQDDEDGGEFYAKGKDDVLTKKDGLVRGDHALGAEEKSSHHVDVSAESDVDLHSELDLEETEKVWFTNLLRKKGEEHTGRGQKQGRSGPYSGVESQSEEEEEEDRTEDDEEDEIVINADAIFKNIYPFFKTEEDPNYLKYKKELQKIVKNKS